MHKNPFPRLLFLALCLAAPLRPWSVAAAEISFAAMQTTRLRGGGVYLASGDFNGDGLTDMVTANGFGYTASLLLSNGDGTFTTRVIFNDPQIDPVVAVGIGDFDGDGNADVAVLSYHINAGFATLTILLGNGDGTFAQGQAINFPDHQRPVWLEHSIAIDDLTGDGRASIVVQSSDLRVFVGNGDGTFQSGQSYQPRRGVPHSVVTGDFNGDGIVDLAFLEEDGIGVFPGVGDGSFGLEVHTPSFIYYPDRDLVVADLDGDGILDLVTVGCRLPLCYAVIHFGVGDGTFPVEEGVEFDRSIIPAEISEFTPFAIALGDFDGDGIPDLAMTFRERTPQWQHDGLYVLPGNGEGSFDPLGFRFDLPDSSISAIVGDFDGDGRQDIAVALSGTGVGLFFNTTK